MPTQKTDVSGEEFGIEYSGSGLTWKIAKGVSVSGTNAGVLSIYGDSKLVNAGTIAGGGAAVAFETSLAGDFAIVNKKSGYIADSFAVVVSGFDGNVSLDNKGKLEGANAAFYATGSGKVTVANTGKMSADVNGIMVYLHEASGRAEIDNWGVIEGGDHGILSFSTNGARFVIDNHKGGLIKGSGVEPMAIEVRERVVLKNDGKIDGGIRLGEFADKIVNKGQIKGELRTGGGDDVVTVKGSISGSVFLSDGDDKLVLKGKGKVLGTIDAGAGNDTIVMGKAADSLLFAAELDAMTNVDRVKNFQSGKDKFYLETEIFTALSEGPLAKSAFHKGTQAADADDRIIYDKKSGALYYDADGAGGVDQIQFAKLDKGAKLKASDFSVVDFYML